MAGSIRIFQIELTDRASGARLTLEAGREFNPQCWYLDFGDLTLHLHPDQAARFGRAIRRLSWRRRARTPGPVWARDVGDNAGPKIKLELGLDEDGFVTVEIGSTRICCGDQQSDDLIYFLTVFADDIATVERASEPPLEPYSPFKWWKPHWS